MHYVRRIYFTNARQFTYQFLGEIFRVRHIWRVTWKAVKASLKTPSLDVRLFRINNRANDPSIDIQPFGLGRCNLIFVPPYCVMFTARTLLGDMAIFNCQLGSHVFSTTYCMTLCWSMISLQIPMQIYSNVSLFCFKLTQLQNLTLKM